MRRLARKVSATYLRLLKSNHKKGSDTLRDGERGHCLPPPAQANTEHERSWWAMPTPQDLHVDEDRLRRLIALAKEEDLGEAVLQPDMFLQSSYAARAG